ncbi:MAG: hypothetical protein Q8L93_04485 [Rhodocyclaceae bacterium]|nr:hypothetical protein [Rhodocyclaceae bacterium]
MWTDPIVDELHHRRREHAARFAFDTHLLFLELKKLDESASAVEAEVVSLPAKRLDTFKQAA